MSKWRSSATFSATCRPPAHPQSAKKISFPAPFPAHRTSQAHSATNLGQSGTLTEISLTCDAAILPHARSVRMSSFRHPFDSRTKFLPKSFIGSCTTRASDSSLPLTSSHRESRKRAAREKVVNAHRQQEPKDESCQGQSDRQMNG